MTDDIVFAGIDHHNEGAGRPVPVSGFSMQPLIVAIGHYLAVTDLKIAVFVAEMRLDWRDKDRQKQN